MFPKKGNTFEFGTLLTWNAKAEPYVTFIRRPRTATIE
jgi:hypothetical protein